MIIQLKRLGNNRGQIILNGNTLGGNMPRWKNYNIAKKKVERKGKKKRKKRRRNKVDEYLQNKRKKGRRERK